MKADDPTAEPLSRATGLWCVVSASAGVRSVPISETGALTIGRSDTCDIVVADESASRRHAILRARTIEDLGSRNGTVVAGRRLLPGESVPIDVGVVIEIGTAMLLIHRGPPVIEPGPPTVGGPVIVDPTMQRLYAMLDVVAPSTLPVLLLGETGTGKEVFASELHGRSARRKQPFLRLNCASLSGSLLESELFGYERGAFTGATQAKPGLFEAGHGGTVFLDEVGELPLETQAKLLRVLDGGEVLRLGSVKPKMVDVRWVAATNRDLGVLAQAGSFRSDLFYRLNGISITIPPLRRRSNDILPLAERFTREASLREGRAAMRLSDVTRQALLAYPWPGNVRELKSVIDRAVVLAAGPSTGGAILPDHLLLPMHPMSAPEPSPMASILPPLPPDATGTPLEREQLLEALQRTGGNQTEAAKLLGVARRTLINRMEKYGLARPRKRE